LIPEGEHIICDWIKARLEQQRRLPEVLEQLSEEWQKIRDAVEHCRLAYNENGDATCGPMDITRGEIILTVIGEHSRTVKVKHTFKAATGELIVTVAWDDGKPIDLISSRAGGGDTITPEQAAQRILDPFFFPEFSHS
jgi:hypothetical protein